MMINALHILDWQYVFFFLSPPNNKELIFNEISNFADEVTVRSSSTWFSGPEPEQDNIWSMAHPAGL